MQESLSRMQLTVNPFEPAASGPPLRGILSPPDPLRQRISNVLSHLKSGEGVKPLAVVGEYGAGKTCLLRWLKDDQLPQNEIKSFLFHDPGVQFYKLADTLLHTIGRKNIAKLIWELAHAHVDSPTQGDLFRDGFENYLSAISNRGRGRAISEKVLTDALQDAILRTPIITTDEETPITKHEEVAHCLARIVTITARKPYFEYRDFIPRSPNSVVAESHEASYFGALLRTIAHGRGYKSIAFLIDEFEEIGLQKRLTRRAAHDYLATLKRLIDLAQDDRNDFWLILSMTPHAYETTGNLEPALTQRLRKIDVGELGLPDARQIVVRRLAAARPENETLASEVFPFPESFLADRNGALGPKIYSNPRALIRVCFVAIAEAVANPATALPFSPTYIEGIAAKLAGTDHK